MSSFISAMLIDPDKLRVKRLDLDEMIAHDSIAEDISIGKVVERFLATHDVQIRTAEVDGWWVATVYCPCDLQSPSSPSEYAYFERSFRDLCEGACGREWADPVNESIGKLVKSDSIVLSRHTIQGVSQCQVRTAAVMTVIDDNIDLWMPDYRIAEFYPTDPRFDAQELWRIEIESDYEMEYSEWLTDIWKSVKSDHDWFYEMMDAEIRAGRRA